MVRALGVAGVVVASLVGLAWPLGGPSLLVLAATALGLQWIAFVPAAIARTERFYDLVGSLTYLTLLGVALAVAPSPSLRGGVLAVCVAVWAVRLGVFLAWRVHRAGKDRRFDDLKTQPSKFFVAWTLQGLWVFLTPLPVWVVLLNPTPGFGWVDAVGLSMWGAGFGLEVVADAQKSAFRADPANDGAFIQHGLWAWSRHPNYFGEILLWAGVFVVASPQLVGVQWLAVLSPIFVTALLVAGSGIPLLEASATKRWGQDPAYQAYRSRTPVLVPRPPSGADHEG